MSPLVVVCFVIGMVAGGLYFRLLWWNTRLFAQGRLAAAIATMIGRFGLLGGGLALVSLHGAAPLLAMALGVLVARSVVMRLMRRAVS